MTVSPEFQQDGTHNDPARPPAPLDSEAGVQRAAYDPAPTPEQLEEAQNAPAEPERRDSDR